VVAADARDVGGARGRRRGREPEDRGPQHGYRLHIGVTPLGRPHMWPAAEAALDKRGSRLGRSRPDPPAPGGPDGSVSSPRTLTHPGAAGLDYNAGFTPVSTHRTRSANPVSRSSTA